jgi:hypothetical protein
LLAERGQQHDPAVLAEPVGDRASSRAQLVSGLLVGVVVVVLVREFRSGVVVTAGGEPGVRVVPWSGVAGVSAVGVELVDGSWVVLDFTAGVRRARVERVAAGLDAALRGAASPA